MQWWRYTYKRVQANGKMEVHIGESRREWTEEVHLEKSGREWTDGGTCRRAWTGVARRRV